MGKKLRTSTLPLIPYPCPRILAHGQEIRAVPTSTPQKPTPPQPPISCPWTRNLSLTCSESLPPNSLSIDKKSVLCELRLRKKPAPPQPPVSCPWTRNLSLTCSESLPLIPCPCPIILAHGQEIRAVPTSTPQKPTPSQPPISCTCTRNPSRTNFSPTKATPPEGGAKGLRGASCLAQVGQSLCTVFLGFHDERRRSLRASRYWEFATVLPNATCSSRRDEV